MQVLVKYCGGCNPLIDRTALVQELSVALGPEVKLTTHPDQAESIGIMVCGCTAACIDTPANRKLAHNWIVVAGENVNYYQVDPKNLADKVKEFLFSLTPQN